MSTAAPVNSFFETTAASIATLFIAASAFAQDDVGPKAYDDYIEQGARQIIQDAISINRVDASTLNLTEVGPSSTSTPSP